MPSERDPRVDPEGGDIFRKGNSTVEVIFAGVEGFGYNFHGQAKDMPPMVRWNEPWRPSWRKWAKTAEVIQRADDAATAKSSAMSGIAEKGK